MKHFVYATSNPGKISEVQKHFETHGIKIETMRDLGCTDLDVPEPGDTLGENAVIKVEVYASELAKQKHLNGKTIFVFSDDTGLEFPALGGEPGVHVRRWKDGVTRMEDEEIITYAMERMHGFVGSERNGVFKTVLAVSLVKSDGSVCAPTLFEGSLHGSLLETPTDFRISGFPFASLFVVEGWNMLYHEIHALPPEKKKSFVSHREKAIDAAIPWLQKQQ